MVLKEVIEALNITEQEFGMTHQTLAANPQTAEFVMLAQQGKFEQKEPKAPKIEKKKTLDVFETSKTLTMENMRKMQTQKMPETGDQMEFMITMMVDQAKMHDEIFLKTGVENDDFEEAMQWYVQKDPEVRMKMTQYMTQMRTEMGKAGMAGGM